MQRAVYSVVVSSDIGFRMAKSYVLELGFKAPLPDEKTNPQVDGCYTFRQREPKNFVSTGASLPKEFKGKKWIKTILKKDNPTIILFEGILKPNKVYNPLYNLKGFSEELSSD